MGLLIFWTGRDQQEAFLANLDDKVRWLRGHVFSPSTRVTYASQRKLYLHFCNLGGLAPVPLSHDNACQYVAFLSNKLAFNSIKQYINVVRIMHLESGHANPFNNSWHIDMLLKGTKRVLGVLQKQKLPITPDIFRRMFTLVNFSTPVEVTFWASCLVAFFSFFRKSNLFVTNLESFNPKLHLCRRDATFSSEGVTLTVRWSKTIQYRQRTLHIPLPHIPNSPLCPSQTLLLALRLCMAPPCAPLFTYPTLTGWLPLTVHTFQSKLHSYLSRLNINPSEYSGHSFRRGGASFALECGLPTEVIQAQGDWTSNAYENYICPSQDMRRQLAATLGSHIG